MQEKEGTRREGWISFQLGQNYQNDAVIRYGRYAYGKSSAHSETRAQRWSIYGWIRRRVWLMPGPLGRNWHGIVTLVRARLREVKQAVMAIRSDQNRNTGANMPSPGDASRCIKQ